MSFGPISATPNLVLFVTDQQRAVQYFPSSWVSANLQNLTALTNTGLTFTNAIINSSRCSPSRGVLMTSLYAPTNQLVDVGGTLPQQWTTLTSRLQAAVPGLQLGYVGKWHMTSSFVGPSMRRPNDASTMNGENSLLDTAYGTPGWDAPDAGTALGWTQSTPPTDPRQPYDSTSNTLGGGPNSYTQNDQRIADDAIACLSAVDPSKPFALIVSLVNPHDIWANMYGGLMTQAFPEFPAAFEALPGAGDFVLPDSYDGDDLGTKPAIQAQTRDAYTQTWATNNGVSIPYGGKLDSSEALTYLKFYAYLTYLADQQLGRVYAALQAMSCFDSTIVVRIADHGELGMSHGGSMEKDVNVYAETLSIPYIFSNAQLFPSATSCDAQAGLVDIVPTLLGILGQSSNSSDIQGTDLSGLLLDPTGPAPSNCSIFTYDDSSPWHIRAIQAAAGAVSVNGTPTTTPYKYAVYFTYSGTQYLTVDLSSLAYELYVPGVDGEITNLQPQEPELQAALHELLTRRMAQLDADGPQGGGRITPVGWPSSPPS